MADGIGGNKIFMVIAAVIIPPLAVGIKRGISWPLLISILLWPLIPIAIIYALWIVLKD
jgi:uncharacterized membrane protein YqaE (UPF0057 family)